MRRTSLVVSRHSRNSVFGCGIAPEARAAKSPQPTPSFEQVYQMPWSTRSGMDKVQARREHRLQNRETTKERPN